MEGIVLGILGLILGLAVTFLVLSTVTAAGRMERKLDALIRHAGIDLTKLAAEEAAVLARAGKKIEAIKVYREYTGCGLAEAKAKVESLAAG
jgi:ribosomal protein L7/L12